MQHYLSIMILILLLPVAHAQTGAAGSTSTAINWHLSAQPLNTALRQLAEHSNTSIMFDAATVRNIQAPSLRGQYTPQEALKKLLSGSGLRAKEIALGRYSIVKATTGAMQQTLPEMTVTGAPDSDSPYSTQYKVPDTTTATKTKTPIMETPMSIQVVPKSVMNDQQAITLGQSLNNVSGVFRGNANTGLVESFNIRGFHNWDYYRDGMRFQPAMTQTGYREIANLERIEVLKGPASILYGRIEPGGMVNLVPKKPQATPYYSLQQQFGSYNLRTTLDATSSLNQDNSLLYRLNFAYNNEGSFRQFIDRNHFFVAPVLQWQISDRTQITLEMEYKTGKTQVDNGVPAIGNRPAKLPRERNLGESFARAEYEDILAGFNWSHAFNNQWEIKHRFYMQSSDQDGNAVSPTGLQADNRTLNRFYGGFRNNENDTYLTSLDLTGHINTLGIEHTLVVGGDYYNYKNTYLYLANYAFPSIDIFNPVHAGSPIPDPAENFWGNSKEEWFGFYFQDQVKLSYNVHLLAGLRYDNARAESNPTYQGVTTFTENKQDKVSPRIGLLWQPVKPISLYGSYVESLGTYANGRGIDSRPLKAEIGKQWEAGVKTELLDGRFSATLAWFHLTKNDMSTPHPDPVLAVQGIAVQTGEARSKGIELNITGELLPGWQMIANYAYTDTEITRANNGTQGNRLPNAPKHAGNIWSIYAFENETLRGLKIGGGVTLRGKREGNLENDYQIPGYAVFNLMTSYGIKVGKTRVTAQLNVNNLFNKEYFSGTSGFGRTRIAVGTPRVFLGSLRVEY
ncbi:TonB-dependent siderophore receptor [Nitrosomonas europaea]|uniref:TonB-dependent siderophore receptor n=2 Tax=Nitrosomonas europaea TaxID=915 RepID=UPI00079711FD|nr:TonB-dependent receptor [Nitrosomonas europaea]KXK50863.1 MAG: TonB-dependent receptor protein [Nitrosomonas europaea]MBV6390099.1 Ferric-pseudobactin 358 receptor [Nitrosomonas europaea]